MCDFVRLADCVRRWLILRALGLPLGLGKRDEIAPAKARSAATSALGAMLQPTCSCR
jgi:hypothetical protein